MPIRLIVLLGLFLAGAIYLALSNDQTIALTLHPGGVYQVTPAVVAVGGYILGALSVYLLYSFDILRFYFDSMRQNARIKTRERVNELYLTAREKILLGRRRDAYKLLKSALSKDDAHLPSLITLGSLQREDGAVTEAIKTHSKARGADPDSAEALLELASDYAACEQYSNAMAILTDARDRSDRSYPLLVRIRDIFVKVENWSEALKVQRLVIDLAPWSTADEEQKNLAAYLYETGLDALNRGEVTAAKDDFRAAIRSNNRFTAAYLKQAECEERLGWGVDAIKTLEKGFKATRSLVLLKFLEALLLKKEGAPRAVGELRWARDIASDVSAIRLFLATAYLAAGDPAAARGEVDRMGGELSSTTIYHLVVAAVQKAEDNVSQALVSMQKAQTAEMATLFIFRCGVCHHSFREYSGRCGNCGSWNALDASIF